MDKNYLTNGKIVCVFCSGGQGSYPFVSYQNENGCGIVCRERCDTPVRHRLPVLHIRSSIIFKATRNLLINCNLQFCIHFKGLQRLCVCSVMCCRVLEVGAKVVLWVNCQDLEALGKVL